MSKVVLLYNSTTMRNAVTYLKRLGSEYLELFMITIQNKKSELTATAEYTQWVIDTQDLTLSI